MRFKSISGRWKADGKLVLMKPRGHVETCDCGGVDLSGALHLESICFRGLKTGPGCISCQYPLSSARSAEWQVV